MGYRISKTYGHDLGLSACFRQHRAASHCRLLHGYALSFKFTFECDELDANNWVLDFGSLKPLREWLCDTFDHKLVVAKDDPQLTRLLALAAPTIDELAAGADERVALADVLVVDRVGCESFAALAWLRANMMLAEQHNRQVDPLGRGVRCTEVEVREHGANSATYTGDI